MSKTSQSKRRILATPSVEPAMPDRLPMAYALRDLSVAPENLRFAEPQDDGVDELAETIFAAGVLQPLTVRPGRGQEKPAMVLDGRRRLLALQSLMEAGRIPDDHPVSCFVETDLARQAAAVVLTNTAAPVHVADVIVAIGKMLKSKLTVSAVAGALGYGELDIRRLAALSELHPKALEALKAGRCSLRQAKLLARLPDRAAQGEIAEAALRGFGFQEWRITERLDAGQVTVHDRRFALVGREGYAAAGGRLESDLFGERADVVLDPDLLQTAWVARAEAFARSLTADEAWPVVITVDETEIDQEALIPFGYSYGMDLTPDQAEAWRTACAQVEAVQQAISGRDLATPDLEPDILAFLRARLTADRAGEPFREVRLLSIFADAATGLEVRAWGPPAPEIEAPCGDTAVETASDAAQNVTVGSTAPSTDDDTKPAPLAVAPQVDLEGVNHRLHELRTDIATRALVRALADDPAAALVAIVARLFTVLVLRQGVGRGGGALSLHADAYSGARTAPIPALDGDVRRRLADRREAWAASSLSPIAWVASLEPAVRLALLAELAGLSLDLCEERTTSLRRSARAEAVEIAALCRADVTLYWTPDAAFLAAHPKAKLLAMLDAMGAEEPLAAGARKDELVALVAARAAERGWAPAYLSWTAEPPQAGEDDEPPPDTPVGGAALDGTKGETPLAA